MFCIFLSRSIPWPNHVVVTSAIASNKSIEASLVALDVFPITKGLDYTSEVVLNYLQVLFFGNMSKIETKEKHIEKAVRKFIVQFNLDKMTAYEILIIESMLNEIILNQSANGKIIMNNARENLKKRTGRNFHSTTVTRIIKNIFESTSEDVLTSISTQFLKVSPAEKAFFEIAAVEVKKILSHE